MKSILKNTFTQAVVKVYGTNVSETISFEQNLANANEIVTDESNVGISFLQWQIPGDGNSKIIISRSGSTVVTLTDNGDSLDFSGNGGFTEYENSLADINIQIVGEAYLYMTLRKKQGFALSATSATESDEYTVLNGYGFIQVF